MTVKVAYRLGYLKGGARVCGRYTYRYNYRYNHRYNHRCNHRYNHRYNYRYDYRYNYRHNYRYTQDAISHSPPSHSPQDVISHEWFTKFDWDGLVNQTLTPPWRPTFKAADDACFFEEANDGSSVIDASEDSDRDVKYSEQLEARWVALESSFVGTALDERIFEHKSAGSPEPSTPKRQ